MSVHRIRRLPGSFPVLSAGLAIAALGVFSGPVLADCPSSHLLFPALGSDVSTVAPTYDVTNNLSWIRGDHTIGVYSLHHDGSLAPTVVTARDRFDVVGVPAGTQVTVYATFAITGWVYTPGCGASGCCGMLVPTIRAFPDTATTTLIGHSNLGRADFSGTVALPVTFIAGTPRDIEFEMYARRCPGGAHTVDATGRVQFVGTDPNAVVVSCKGFGPVSVPAHRPSWGRLKTIYR